MTGIVGGAEGIAYELLVEQHCATLADLAAVWAEPEPLPAVLARLEAAGLVSRRPGTPTRYVASNPDVVVDTLLAEREAQVDQADAYAERLARTYRARRTDDDRALVVEVVLGHRAVRQRLTQVQRSARYEILCLDQPPYVDPSGTSSIDLELLADGISCRYIYDRAAIGQTGLLAGVETLIRAGQQARVLPDLPMKLCLVDDRLAMLPLERGPASTEAAIVVHPSALLDALRKLFEGLWYRAVPLRLSPGRPLGTPREHSTADEDDDEKLVALLLSGITDEAIARHLGVGYRTVQRRIAALLDRLGAHTRFQAGVQAALRERSARSRA